MVEFRIGDVVGMGKNEATVSQLGATQVLLDLGGSEWGWCAAAYLTLLRRPVRVGDRLRRIGGNDEVEASQADATWAHPERSGWEHADGTPIDPAKPRNVVERVNDSLADAAPRIPSGTVTTVRTDGSMTVSGPNGTMSFDRAGIKVVPFPVGPAADRDRVLDEVANVRERTLEAWSSVAFTGSPGALKHPDLIEHTLESLTLSLFSTDPDVVAFVNRRAEDDVSEKRAAIMKRCFDRGFAGESPEWAWYVRSADRAKAMTGGG